MQIHTNIDKTDGTLFLEKAGDTLACSLNALGESGCLLWINKCKC